MIRAAIIGLGTWGQNLVRNVQGISPAIRFVAGATRTPDKGRGFAEAQGIRLLPRYEDVLADPEVEAVVLATPHRQHTDQIVAAAAAGKHVFTEKPLGVDTAGAQRAAQGLRRGGGDAGGGLQLALPAGAAGHPPPDRDGTLGRVLHLEGNFCGPSVYRFPAGHWRHEREEGPAGGMTGRGVHVVDAMLYLAGPIQQVTAQSFRLVQDYGLDDTTSMLFRFASGATG